MTASATRIFLGLALVSLAFAAPAQQSPEKLQGEAERAKGKISMCMGCHHIPDYRTAYPTVYSVPMIAGQTPGYIDRALRAYRSGERTHPSMHAVARGLSDQDIADLAAFYGTVE